MKAFVLMPYAPPIGDYYVHVFKPALEQGGYSVTRADDLFAPRPIILDIQESILHADLLLCEMTGKNANVFYELGIAHALGKPTILVAQRQEDIPFDLRHIRAILYEPTEAGWEDYLRSRITAAANEARQPGKVWPPPLTIGSSSPPKRQRASKRQTSFPYSLMTHEERIIFHFPTRDGRVIYGPYPYRFDLTQSVAAAVLIEAKIWARSKDLENVIAVGLDGGLVSEIRQGYQDPHRVRLDVGNIEAGSHYISFDAHYEDVHRKPAVESNTAGNAPGTSSASRYWILRQLVVVG